ncbi:MAG: hypothetical protein U5J83_16955 [Bryobacterales bacterium]|nr:hypothetical protein [Bryobacterales bacterium]
MRRAVPPQAPPVSLPGFPIDALATRAPARYPLGRERFSRMPVQRSATRFRNPREETMERRDFVKTTIAGSAIAGPLLQRALGKAPLAKRPYRDGIQLSIIGFGGIVVVGQQQPMANKSVANAIDVGINYFDVAPRLWQGGG